MSPVSIMNSVEHLQDSFFLGGGAGIALLTVREYSLIVRATDAKYFAVFRRGKF